MTTLLALSGCATPQAKASPPNQLQELPVTGLDTMNRKQCFHAALQHHNGSWRVVSATPPTTGRLYNSLHHASWSAVWNNRKIDASKLRYVRLLLRGKGLLGEAKAEAMCIFEVKQNALTFIQVCAVDRMEVRCALDFIQG